MFLLFTSPIVAANWTRKIEGLYLIFYGCRLPLENHFRFQQIFFYIFVQRFSCRFSIIRTASLSNIWKHFITDVNRWIPFPFGWLKINFAWIGLGAHLLSKFFYTKKKKGQKQTIYNWFIVSTTSLLCPRNSAPSAVFMRFRSLMPINCFSHVLNSALNARGNKNRKPLVFPRDQRPKHDFHGLLDDSSLLVLCFKILENCNWFRKFLMQCNQRKLSMLILIIVKIYNVFKTRISCTILKGYLLRFLNAEVPKVFHDFHVLVNRVQFDFNLEVSGMLETNK